MSDHPTMADYAYSAAQDNSHNLAALGRRVGQLENTVNQLIDLLSETGAPIPPRLLSPKVLAQQRADILRLNAEAREADRG